MSTRIISDATMTAVKIHFPKSGYDKFLNKCTLGKMQNVNESVNM